MIFRTFQKLSVLWAISVLSISVVGEEPGKILPREKWKPLFEENFSKVEPGELPEAFLVMEGGWQVAGDDAESRTARIPGAPLGRFGFLFGDYYEPGKAVQATFEASRKGRISPSFSVGLYGIGGYHLRVSPAKRKLELVLEDEIIAEADYRWTGSGTVTQVELLVVPISETGPWHAEGRVWIQGDSRPEKPTIAFDSKEEPYSGQASVWVTPYSGTPVNVDNIHVFDVAATGPDSR